MTSRSLISSLAVQSLSFLIFLYPPLSRAEGVFSENLIAQNTSTGTKVKYNTNLYESDDSSKEKNKQFAAKVRVIREISDDVEVFFEGNDKAKGAYTLPRRVKDYAVLLKALEESKKPNGPNVSVTVDGDKNILAVQISQSHGPEAPAGFKAPTDPNQKWNFGKMPD